METHAGWRDQSQPQLIMFSVLVADIFHLSVCLEWASVLCCSSHFDFSRSPKRRTCFLIFSATARLILLTGGLSGWVEGGQQVGWVSKIKCNAATQIPPFTKKHGTFNIKHITFTAYCFPFKTADILFTHSLSRFVFSILSEFVCVFV